MKTILRAFVAVAIFATPALAQDAPSRVLFTNVNVWDGTSDGLQNGMSVLVEGNLITQIAASIRAPKTTCLPVTLPPPSKPMSSHDTPTGDRPAGRFRPYAK